MQNLFRRASPEEVTSNMVELETRVSQLIDHMTGKRMLDLMPPGLRLLCRAVAEQSRKLRPSHTRIYVGSLLMLRYFSVLCLSVSQSLLSQSVCVLLALLLALRYDEMVTSSRVVNPALFSAEEHGLATKVTASVRRSLILVSKVLQHLANDVQTFRKEPFLAFLSGDIWKRLQRLLYAWFDEIVEVRYNPQSVHERTPTAEGGDHHRAHVLLFAYQKQISRSLTPADSEGNYNRLYFYSLNTFSFLSIVTVIVAVLTPC